jgi:NAD(P)-dependent dehydrogenase (short-subunit alcohol dehydrogenase family)
MTAAAPGPAMFDLSGRGIGITGGGGHLGRALAIGLAEMGAQVVICGRSAAPLEATMQMAVERRLQGSIVGVVADVSTDHGVGTVLDRIEREAGPVHGWINNAYAGSTGPLLGVTRVEIAATVASCLADVIAATEMVAGRMIPTGGGAIVNMASMYGLVSPQPGAYQAHPEFRSSPAYGGAKAGIVQFTRYAACELAPHGIRVNAISPGPFPGPTVEMAADFVAELTARVPMQRIGRPEELCGAAVFLLSDAASYVTGHNLVVDGGWTAW